MIETAPIEFPEDKRKISPELKDLILQMLERDSEKRIKMDELRKHAFLNASM